MSRPAASTGFDSTFEGVRSLLRTDKPASGFAGPASGWPRLCRIPESASRDSPGHARNAAPRLSSQLRRVCVSRGVSPGRSTAPLPSTFHSPQRREKVASLICTVSTWFRV